MNKVKENKRQHIKVFVRVRPLNNNEKQTKSASIVECPSPREICIKDKTSKNFTFDKVFGPASQQVEVYKSVVCPLIKEVLDGYNCTVFAYGQTGTGKTFTMEGCRSDDRTYKWHNDPLSGIIPRALGHLFDELRLLEIEYSVRVSFLEIYNEELFDLLSPVEDNSKIRLFEDVMKKGAVIINGLEEVTVANKDEVYNIMEKGSKKRQTAATLMNTRSSRSHTVFSITVHIKENTVEGEELLKTGKLNLVDLAGSENIGRSGAIEKRAREAGNINQSLLTLGRVITALVERAPHVPYRESKLTRLLQESLGGRTKTSIIATVSPASCNLEETLSTLDYAHRAKNIQNKPEVNQKIGKIALIKEYTEEIERLKRDLIATREKTGIFLAEENYNAMIQQIDSQNRELTELLTNVKTLNETLEKKEEINQRLNLAVQEYLENIATVSAELEVEKNNLQRTEEERDEKVHLLEEHVKTEENLSKQANDLLSVADIATKDTYLLHNTLSRKISVEDTNLRVCRTFEEGLHQTLLKIGDLTSLFEKESQKYHGDLRQFLCNGNETACRNKEKACEMIDQESEGQIRHIEKADKVCGNMISEGLKIAEHLQQISETAHEGESKENAQLFDLLVANLQNALTLQSFMKAENDMLKSKLLQRVADHEKNTQEFASEMCRDIKDAHLSVQQLKESIVALEKNVVDMEEKKAKAQRGFKEHLEQQIREFQQQLLTEVETGWETVTPELAAMRNTITVTNPADITGYLKAQEERISGLETNSKSLTADIHECISKYNETATQSLSECETIQTTMLERVNVEIADGKQRKMNHLETVKGKLKELEETLLGTQENVQNELQITQTSISDASVSYKQTMERSLADQLELIGNSKTCLANCSNQVVTLRSSLLNEVQDCELKLNRFVTEEVIKDVPTGNTPQRREFSYPQELAATSPHERILFRYRAAKKASQEQEQQERVELPATEQCDGVATSSGSSESSSESSVCSSLPIVDSEKKSDSDDDDLDREITFSNMSASEPNLANLGNFNMQDKENLMLSHSLNTSAKVQRAVQRPVLTDHNE